MSLLTSPVSLNSNRAERSIAIEERDIRKVLLEQAGPAQVGALLKFLEYAKNTVFEISLSQSRKIPQRMSIRLANNTQPINL